MAHILVMECRLVAHRDIFLRCKIWSPLGHSGTSGRMHCNLDLRVASPATATTDFLAPDILNKCGRAVSAFWGDLHRTLTT